MGDAEGFSIDTVKAMLYVKYGITTFDKFYGYMINAIVYGKLYPMINWTSGFKEIDFLPADVLCYTWNASDSTGSRKTTREIFFPPATKSGADPGAGSGSNFKSIDCSTAPLMWKT